MTSVDPRTPVVAGAGQCSQRVEPAAAREPLALLEDAARLADTDTRARRSLLERAEVIGVVEITSWRYPDPAALLAERLGIAPRATLTTTTGGNSPQLLVNEVAGRIARGDLDIALLGGAEAMYTRWRARRPPRVHLEWGRHDGAPGGERLGDSRPGSSDYEMAHLALAPTQVYPLLETALRARAGRGIEEHQQFVSELWAGFSAVAAQNPYAWSRQAYTPEEIRTVGPDNRMVVFPYPKRMCSNIDVDQSAALLLCSYGAARDAGVPDDRLVFLHSGADVHDHWFITERDSLAAAPGIGTAVRAALTAASIGADDIARFDLYSCFPAAIEIALDSIGLRGPAGGDSRPLTLTGGLGFAGGPVNNYATHGIATAVGRLRADPASFALTTALGWYATKHSVGVWSGQPPASGYRRVAAADLQPAVDALPRRAAAGLVDGDVTVEATSVAFERDGTPSVAIVAGLTPDGRRALANTRDAALLDAMTEEPWEGRVVRLTNDGSTNEVAQ